MKKLLIVLGVVAAFLTATAFIIPEKTDTLPGPGDVCKIVGNCSVNLQSLGDGKYKVTATNNNNYKVTVNWTAVGYDSYGRQRQVGSGSLALGTFDKKTKTSSPFTTSCTDVSLGNVEVLDCGL